MTRKIEEHDGLGDRWFTVSEGGHAIASYSFNDWGGRDRAYAAAEACGATDPDVSVTDVLIALCDALISADEILPTTKDDLTAIKRVAEAL